jgi:probable DNA repair protein
LIGEAGSCSELQRVLRRVEKLLRKIPQEQTPGEWMRDIEALLAAFGWPGDQSPNSQEFQTIAAWSDVLSGIAKIELITPRIRLSEALDRLHRQAAESRFQAEDEGAPIQVMGMLEASGLRFDHLWILGLHDEALPASANPNPFLPLSLQRQHRLPHSSAERELEFATDLIERLLVSAPHIVVSYPGTEGDRVLAPTPLLAGGSWIGDDAAQPSDWMARMREVTAFEEIADETAPLLAQSDSTGGASLFKDMAACPFRAFAKYRLGARPLEQTDLGLSYRDRGTTVHKALEFIWRELGSHARLVEMSAAGLEALISAGADAAVDKLGPGIGRDLEKRRLQKLLPEWLEIEKLRAEFSVRASEVDLVVEIGGLQVRLRADRVDTLPDGREIILDYKTGQLKPHGWEGERPDEPQLPLYCATSDRPAAGAAFAAIRTGELRFRGLTAADVSLPSLAKMSIEPPLPFAAQVAEWRRVLEHLAVDFRSGNARIDPKPDACDHCGLRALCRIREYEAAAE